MKSKGEGVVKYNVKFVKTEPLSEEVVKNLNHWRHEMFKRNLIGIYNEPHEFAGIGFGNISEKQGDRIIASGTQTGHIEFTTGEHYAYVTYVDYNKGPKGEVGSEGPIEASSEAMTHKAIYDSDSTIGGIIHIHHKDMWDKMLSKFPTTSADAEYGTKEMTNEVLRVFKETNVKGEKIFVMAGHEEGIFSFGKNLEEAGEIMLQMYKLYG